MEGHPELTITAGDGQENVFPDFSLTALSFSSSANRNLRVSAYENFHIVFGHRPDFALSENIHADLLLAGHSHGGQVQLPFIGALITASAVPRHWVNGDLIKLAENRHLVVSRGIGMERGEAPRLRFLCRPQLVIIDLVPERSDADS